MRINESVTIASLGPDVRNNPLLKETIPASQIQQHYGEFLKNLTPDAVERARQNATKAGVVSKKLIAAGMKLVLGSDTGQTRFFVGWYPQILFESWVTMGFTPMEAIVFATRD